MGFALESNKSLKKGVVKSQSLGKPQRQLVKDKIFRNGLLKLHVSSAFDFLVASFWNQCENGRHNVIRGTAHSVDGDTPRRKALASAELRVVTGSDNSAQEVTITVAG
eukprot:6467056-Amphidinium_carterae.2